MYQAATQVKLSRPEIIIVVKAEALHYDRRQNTCYRHGEIRGAHWALRVWHDTRWGLRELGRTVESFAEGKKERIRRSMLGQVER